MGPCSPFWGLGPGKEKTRVFSLFPQQSSPGEPISMSTDVDLMDNPAPPHRPGSERNPAEQPYRAPLYRGTSLIRNRLPLGPYSRPMPRALRWS
ncbi:hypothetical protein T484DRAFT_2358500 [Baffinella frigidus]|nr:hypothetical protein T484DRAFT_2358500 [Cryptophyta sp. CCMP2293]